MLAKTKASLIAATAAILLVAGCSGGSAGSSNTTDDAGKPVSGGTLRVLEMSQPTGFDPVQVFSSTSMPVTFSALYGQFLITNPETGEYECGLCESFTTSDGGATWDVVMRDGVTFTDGTALDAQAVKFNWERIKDPASGSASAGVASQIDRMEVVDKHTLKLHMAVPNPGFIGLMPVYSLQWIASPTALKKGQAAFNKKPVGAGPFVFESWTPGGTLKLKRNPDYSGTPAHLDALEIQGVKDEAQRLNALVSGQADLALSATAPALAEAKAAGFPTDIYTFNGGVGFMLNTAKAPFDDVRARQALNYALDLGQISDAIDRGNGSVPETLFRKDSPFYQDIPLHTHDPKRAQELFDELAAEGKPVKFSYTVFPGPGSITFDALQAQLAKYKNVTVTADQRDASELGVVTTTGDYQVATSSLAFVDPGSRLWGALSGEADRTNYSRINDKELNAAVSAAQSTTDLDEQKKQYKIVQERLADQVPYILFQNFLNGAIMTDKVHGVTMYGYTTPAAVNLWLEQ